MSENARGSTAPRIAVLATMDTKGAEARFLVAELAVRGMAPFLIDIALSGESPHDAVISRADLARGGATDPVGDDRTTAMTTTADAAASVLRELLTGGDLDGVIGIGGGTGGWMAQRALEGLPFGFPKVVVTTVVKASGEHDIVFLPSVVDVAGLNALLRTVLRNAAAVLAGLTALAPVEDDEGEARPAIAMTMFGVTTAGGDVARATLEAAGFDVVVFHATGAGGRTMERLIADGQFAGILDWTTTEIVQNVAGGLCDAGPDRLRAAAESGVAQVVVPGAIDVINVMPPIPDKFSDRVHHWHLPTVPLVRASAAESSAAGRWVGMRLSGATAAATVLVPVGGYSSLDVAGGVFWDPAADEAFVSGVRETAGDHVEVQTRPHHINDPAFAREAAEILLSLIDATADEKE